METMPPFPNVYSFENLEAVSDDVQQILQEQEIFKLAQQERNEALGLK